MKFSRELLQQIRERVDMVELVNGYTTLQRRGDRWWGLSPFKNEKTPSFSVKPEDGLYYCFATNQGGDIFRFVAEMEGLSFPEAVSYLAERVGVSIEGSGEISAADRERAALLELYQRVAGSFHHLLVNDPRGSEALAYAHERGVSPEAITHFGLGYAPDNGTWLHQFLRSKSYSDSFLAQSGLFSRKNDRYSLFRHRLMFPIRDERGRTVAFGGRALRSDERAKYINSPETTIYSKKRLLFGIDSATAAMRSEKRVYITEGYLDVIALFQAGILNAVAPLGTAFTAEQATLLKRWVTDVVLVFDADSAGIAATFKAAEMVERAGLGCHVVAVPEGQDPAELYQQHGREGVQALLKQHQPAFEFLLDHAAQELTVGDIASRELLLRKVFPYISIIASEVRREAALERVSDIAGVSLRAVQSDFNRLLGGKRPERIEEQRPSGHTSYKPSRDFALMLATAHDSELFAYLRQHVEPTDIEDETARSLFVYLEDAYRHDESLKRGLLDRIDDESLRELVLLKLTTGEFGGWTRHDLERATKLIRVRKLEAEQHRLETEMKRAEASNPHLLQDLLARKMGVDQELSELKVRAND